MASSFWEDDRSFEMEDPDDGSYSNHHHLLLDSHTHSLSRLSTCTNNPILAENDENYDHDDYGGIKNMLSRLSIETFDADGDADEEISDGKSCGQGELLKGSLFSDSDDDKAASYSLPATPPRQRHPSGGLLGKFDIVAEAKQYASDNDEQKLIFRRSERTRSRRRKKRILRRMKRLEDSKKDGTVLGENDDSDLVATKTEMGCGGGWNQSFSGESEGGGGGGGGLRVITRPKGGKRSLCMDLEEVKACRDLGFELEHERMFDMAMPSRLSLSASTLDTATTSSGGSSPIPNWRISSPGDDPRDVKARLKVWAQAVALASTYRQGGC